MSSVSATGVSHMTLGTLASRYGFELATPHARAVTITSLADAVEDVVPGSLFIAHGTIGPEKLQQISAKGAYAVMVPSSARATALQGDIAVVVGEPNGQVVGALAASLVGSPAMQMAIFAFQGENRAHYVDALADFLHILGNPVAVLSAHNTQTMDHMLNVNFPLSALDVQRILSVCVEDGAAAVICALDEQTFKPDALQSVSIDVVGVQGESNVIATDQITQSFERLGAILSEQGQIVTRNADSDQIAQQANEDNEISELDLQAQSLAIAMTIAAGVKKSSIKNALRVSRELQ